LATRFRVRGVGTWWRRAAHSARMANWVLELSDVPKTATSFLSLGSTTGPGGGKSTGMPCKLAGTTTRRGLASASGGAVSIFMHQAQCREPEGMVIERLGSSASLLGLAPSFRKPMLERFGLNANGS